MMDSAFKEYFNFLSAHMDLYNFQLTKIFVDSSALDTHLQWLQFLAQKDIEDLNDLPFLHKMETAPVSLQKFVTTAISLSYNREISHAKDNQFEGTNFKFLTLSKEEKRGMNPKKCHEIEQLTSLVHSCSKETSSCNVIDVGSGLGYLGQILSQRFGLSVCGLECEDCRTHGAEAWVKKKDGNQSKLSTITFTLKDDEKCYEDFRTLVCSLLKESNSLQLQLNRAEINDVVCSGTSTNIRETEEYSESNTSDSTTRAPSESEKVINSKYNYDTSPVLNGVCMTGLHCCGDLTPTMLKFFLRCPEVTSLVCLGCCYHNMTEKQDESGFKMFPLSEELKQVFSQLDGHNIITKFALRLAAQETRTRWRSQSQEEHQFHTNNVAFRGLMELFCCEENIPFVKEKRKVARKKDYKDLNTYITAVLDRTKLDRSDEYIRKRLTELYEKHKENIKLIEAMTCLQVVLQPVIESLIIKDRIAYLQEHNIKAEVVPVFDENVSPRNLAIVAMKQ